MSGERQRLRGGESVAGAHRGSDAVDSLTKTTRRLGVFAGAYGLLAALVLLVVGTPLDLLVLTAGVAASIFLLRSLRAQVAHLDPRAPRAAGRAILGALGRYAALAFFLLALYEYGSRHAFAAALGAACLPCALLVETVVQTLGGRPRPS